MSFLDGLFGKPKETNKDAENAARAEALRQQKLNTESFVAGGAPVYDQGQQYYFNELGQLEQLGPSEMQNIETDPRLIQAQYDALRELETRGREGFTARDELDRLKTKQDVAKENAGRLGAIQQNMAARGMGGSGMDLVAQLQASQAATEREALAGLERNAAQEANRSNASAQAGGLAGNIRGQGFQENSAKAQAQDAINRFNTANSVNRSMYNNRGLNEVGQQNVGRANQTLDKNTDARYGFRKDAYGIQNNQYNQNYNAATEDLNQKRIQDEQARARKQAQISGITTLAGAGIGAATAGPGGAMKGAQMGAGIGNAAGGAFYAHGGTVKGKDCYASGGMIPGEEILPWDDTANDTVQINASPGEIVIPKSIANDPIASAQFVDRENRKQMQAARSQQDIAGLGNILGKAATDYGNAQNQGVVLANRMQDLGQKPAMFQTEKRQYDSSVLDNLGKMGVDRASEDAKQRENAFGRDVKLKQMADEKAILASKRDPNSEESLMARSMLAEMAPQFAKNTPGFANLSAERLEQIYPKLRDKMDFDQKERMQKESIAARRASDAIRGQEFGLRMAELKDTKQNRLDEKQAALVTPLGNANTPDDAKQLKEGYEAKKSFDAKIQEMIDLRKKFGGEMFNREAVSRGKQLSQDLLLEYKNMAKLGVLSESDKNIINAIIPEDPLAFQASGLVGQDPIMNNLKKFKEDTDRDFKTRVQTRLKSGQANSAGNDLINSIQLPGQSSQIGNDEAASLARQKRIMELKAKAGK